MLKVRYSVAIGVPLYLHTDGGRFLVPLQGKLNWLRFKCYSFAEFDVNGTNAVNDRGTKVNYN